MAELDLEACCEMGRKAAEAQPPVAAHQRVLDALHPGNVTRAVNALRATGRSADSYAHDFDHTISTVIDLRSMEPQTQAAVARLGLSVPVLSLIAQDLVGYAATLPMKAEISPEEQAFITKLFLVTRMYVRRFYQDPFIQAGGMVTLDPFTGERLVSTHSFIGDALHVLYRFEGLETFYLGIGSINGAIRFLGIPRLNCVVAMPSTGEDEGHVRWGIAVYRRTMARIMANAAEMEGIFRAPRTRVGVLVGFWPNFAHYLWQDISGLQEILDVHGAKAISHILVGPYSDFSIPEVFPELAAVPMQHIERPIEAFDVTFRSDTQYIRPIGVLIQPALRERLARAAERHAPAKLQARIAGVTAERFLVWVTLRKNKKVWARQIEGHIAVLQRLAKDVGPMAVVIDGWANTQEEADRLRAGLEPGIEVISILGCGVYENFLWARAAHVYSNVVGSGLFMNTYFACRPGVAHSNPRHLDQAAYWAAQSPGSCEPVFFTRAETQGEGDLHADYDFDPELLYLKLRGVVREHYPARLRNPDETSDVAHRLFGSIPTAEGGPSHLSLVPGLPLRNLHHAGSLASSLMLDPGGELARVAAFFAQPSDPTVAQHGHMMTDPASLTYRAPPAIVGAIENAVTLLPDGLVLMGQTVLGDTYFGSSIDGPESRPGRAEALADIRQRLANGVQRVSGQGFCGVVRHWQDPGHWMVAGLPRLTAFAALRLQHRDMKLILPPLPENGLAAQAMRLLGIEQDAVLTMPPERAVAFDTTWVMSDMSLWGVSPVTRAAAETLAARVFDILPPAERNERIFVKPPGGALANEEEITVLLARHGFALVDVEALDLASRIQAFRGARHVVGLHGWHLTSILFAPAGSSLLEIFSPVSVQPMYWSIASRCGMRYGYMVGEHVSTREHPHPGWRSALRIAPDLLAQAVDKMARG